MSTNLPAVPEYMKALMINDPAMAALFDAMTSGISTGMPPTIVGCQGQFVQKEGGVETIVRYPDFQSNGQPHPAAGEPVSVISVVVLGAKEGLEKAYYATAYTPGQEAQSPDCFSLDGIKPDPSCSDKQCESCAGCPQNMFGTGKDQNGNPLKGKACADRKVLSVFANNGTWRFAIPPATLQTWVAYVNALKAHGVLPVAVITKIGFDPQDKHKYTFTFAGMLTEQQLPKIIEMAKSDEVMTIIGKKAAPPAAQVENKSNVADLAEEKAKKDAEAKAKKDAEAKAKKETAAAAKKKTETAAAETQGDLDLGLGLDSGTVIETTAVKEEAGADDIIASLGL